MRNRLLLPSHRHLLRGEVLPVLECQAMTEEYATADTGTARPGPADYEALAWIRRKLGLPADAQMFSGQTTIAGALHVLCSHAHGFDDYIRAHKCDDKQGEIARLTVQVRELEEQATGLILCIKMALAAQGLSPEAVSFLQEKNSS